MIDLEKILHDNIFTFLRPSFPQLSEKQVEEKVRMYITLTEVYPVIVQSMREACNQTANEIGKQLDEGCREHIAISGIRYNGIHRTNLLAILEKYGYTEYTPF